jgi:H+/Cl- antiporter ClcA
LKGLSRQTAGAQGGKGDREPSPVTNEKVKIVNNYRTLLDVRKLPILYKSVLVGLAVGIIVNAYRFALVAAEKWSLQFYGTLRGHLQFIPLVFLALGLIGYGVGLLVSRYKMISGSGIPQVSGIILGYFRQNWLTILLAKFFGGAISVLAGLSLGREGPSIQLGACAAQGVGECLSSSKTEKKILIASGASAGLSSAFNAPLAGAIFAVEEIFKYFSPVVLLSTMVSAMVAVFITEIVFGMGPVFCFRIEESIQLNSYWLIFLLGALLGVAGAFYNRFLLLTQRLYRKISLLDLRTRLMVPFLLAGVVGLLFPLALGGGHHVVEQLQPSSRISFLLLLLAVKFLFSMISFGSGAPGGIFFPLLIIGATIGAIFSNSVATWAGINPALFGNWVVLAMAGYFTAIVRAPITGIILLVEMTGSLNHLLPLTVVSIAAYVTADLLKSKPIYESLLENQIKEYGFQLDNHDAGRRITIDTIVHHGALVENKAVYEMDLPRSCLLIAIRRHGHDIIPRGDTRIFAQDYLIVLTSVNKEARVREILNHITKS